MIVVMQPGCDQQHIDHVVELVREMGLQDHVIVGTDRTVVAAVGDKRQADKSRLENCAGVEKVVPILAPYKIASREVKQEQSQIALRPGGGVIGGKAVGVIAGPCSVESRQQILQTAEAIREAGAIGLRGGAFKPRTNPYSFQGLGEEGLKLLREAGDKTGLAVVTEVLSIDELRLVGTYADVIQVGARNMHNFKLLAAVGQVGKPVLLKRGWAASFEEFLLAAEYIISAGTKDVILCERGIRTFEDYVRNTLPLAIIPAIHRASHLPIAIDPSHGTGHAYMVPDMCRAAIAAGADALILEVHPDPEHALTDGAQSINLPAFAELMKSLAPIANAIGREL